MTPPQNPLSIKRAILIVAATTVLGTAISTYLAIHQRKIYRGWALIENPEYATHPERLTKLRAEIVAWDLDLENRWATTLEAATATVSSSVKLEQAPEGLLVSVMAEDPKDAMLIARDVADSLASPKTEALLASKWKGVADLQKTEDVATTYQLEKLLNEQAKEAGFTGYSAVLKGAAKSDEKAVSLAGNEDFSRRWSMLQNLAPKIGLQQQLGEPMLMPQHMIKVGGISTKPESNAAQITVQIGRFGGMAVGGLLVLALLRWKPGFMRPAPRGPTPTPAWAKSRSATPKASDDPW